MRVPEAGGTGVWRRCAGRGHAPASPPRGLLPCRASLEICGAWAMSAMHLAEPRGCWAAQVWDEKTSARMVNEVRAWDERCWGVHAATPP